MKLWDLRKEAKKLCIKPCRMKKTDLIKAIQKAEGNLECFGTNPYGCNQFECCWRDDCINKANQI